MVGLAHRRGCKDPPLQACPIGHSEHRAVPTLALHFPGSQYLHDATPLLTALPYPVSQLLQLSDAYPSKHEQCCAPPWDVPTARHIPAEEQIDSRGPIGAPGSSHQPEYHALICPSLFPIKRSRIPSLFTSIVMAGAARLYRFSPPNGFIAVLALEVNVLFPLKYTSSPPLPRTRSS